MANPSAQCFDLSTVFVANGLAPHTYPSGVVTSLTAGGVPQTCLSVGAPSGPSTHPQQPQLQFIATSGAGPALIAANPGGPHVSNSGGGRYGSNPNYGNSYYGHHQYNTYPKSHGPGGGGGHHRGGPGGVPNSNSGGGQSSKPYRSGKYANNSGYMSAYHQQQQHHSNHAPAIYTGYPQSSVTYHPQASAPSYAASNAMTNSVELQQQLQHQPAPALVASGPVNSNNVVLASQPVANSNSTSVASSTLMNPPASTSAISNCVNTNTSVASSKDVLYAPNTTSTEPRESREREHHNIQQPQREPREPRERERPEPREPREQHREQREYREPRGGPRDPRPLSKGNGYSSGTGYRNKRDGYTNNYQPPQYVPLPTAEVVDGPSIIRTKPERSGSGKYVRNGLADRSGPSGVQVPKSTTTLERERTGSATLPAASRPSRGHPTLHPIGGGVGAGGAAATAASAAAGGHSTAEQPFNLLATAFPPLPGMDSVSPSGGETAESTASTTASVASTGATVTNHPNTDAQGVGSNNTAGGTTPTAPMPTTKSHDTSLANVVKGGGHATTAAPASSVAAQSSNSTISSHHSEDSSANYSENSSQPLKSSKSSTASATVLLPSPTSASVVLLNQGLNHEQSAKSAVPVASNSNSKALHKSSANSAASTTNHESTSASAVVGMNNKSAQHAMTSDSAATPAQMSKVGSAESTSFTKSSNSSTATAHQPISTITNELSLSATPSLSSAASNNTSVVAGDLVNHDSSASSSSSSHHDYHHKQQHQSVNHIGSHGDSTSRHHSSNSVSFVRLSESSLNDFPLVTDLPSTTSVESSGQHSPGSSLTYAQIAQRQKAAKALSVPQAVPAAAAATAAVAASAAIHAGASPSLVK